MNTPKQDYERNEFTKSQYSLKNFKESKAEPTLKDNLLGFSGILLFFAIPILTVAFLTYGINTFIADFGAVPALLLVIIWRLK